MNLLLLRAGYPPIAVRPEDRKVYLDALEHASMHEDIQPFHLLLYQRLNSTLDDYLGALEEAQPPEIIAPNAIRNAKPASDLPSKLGVLAQHRRSSPHKATTQSSQAEQKHLANCPPPTLPTDRSTTMPE